MGTLYHISHLLDAKLLTEAAPTSLAMETPEPKSSPDSPPPHSATMALLGVRSDSEESLSDDESRLSDGDPWCLAATSHPFALNPFGIRLPWCLIPKSSCNPVDGRAIGRWSLTSTHSAGLATLVHFGLRIALDNESQAQGKLDSSACHLAH